MSISHLFLNEIGPFKTLHLDLSGPDGFGSRGPHVLAGVNGSGKSTILKAIAWLLATSHDQFPIEEWVHFLHDRSESKAAMVLDLEGKGVAAWAITTDREADWERRLMEWLGERLVSVGLEPKRFPLTGRYPGLATKGEKPFSSARFGEETFEGARFNVAAYSSARTVRYIADPDLAFAKGKITNKFGFDLTVQNEALQAWLLSLYSKRAIAKERHESSSGYTATFDALERGLRHICGEDVSIVVDIEPSFRPKLRIGKQELNFSQVPDGVRATLGWLADFLMRSESTNWDPSAREIKSGILLFDEIEGYLHPLWQRRILPAMKEALRNTQIIATSHSPFVISSCPDAFIHVLRIRDDGHAYVESRVQAPIGESITSTLKDIFGVTSRFDIRTEKELAEWNELRAARANGKSEKLDDARFQELTKILSLRSEELRSLVHPVAKLSASTVDKLTASSGVKRTPNRNRRAGS